MSSIMSDGVSSKLQKPKALKRFRSAGDTAEVNRYFSDLHAVAFKQPDEDGYDGRTQQSFGRECDINTIFAKYRVTGTVRVNSRARQPYFADVPSNLDLRRSLDVVRRSQEGFAALPADVRKLFDNDYTKVYSFLNDPSKLEESYRLGLRVRPAEPVPEPAPRAPLDADGIVVPKRPTPLAGKEAKPTDAA